ncbi:MAG: hypothetical protein AUJ53_08895 [Flavobacteriaceae bacterium CG1_02_35_72]|nr:MAG: hypothetical protein AUJ53_08895 [Flavobacteriaceae bacterium CG1_02_35_72]
MLDFNYKKWNSILGWVTFAIALFTYTSTIEPTVSFWDCGEYLSTAIKLQVGHEPGAPLFQMLGAFFAIFASDKAHMAMMVNFMSALASAFTILFLFWTITRLSFSLLKAKNATISYQTQIAILGSGMVGALAYTFSDTFWFSAVESEVYALSSMLLALLFWLGLRWEADMDSPRGNKWLLILCFVIGLSFGVHVMSLLVIPAIAFIYYFKRYQTVNTKNFIIANILAVLALAFVFQFLFPFTLKYFSALELFFVNNLGLPFNSGSIIAALILIFAFIYGLKYTKKHHFYHANTLILGILFVMLGFSSWIMLPVRATANPPINMSDPSSARELLAYYNREQYGDVSLFYESYYSVAFERELDENKPYIDGKPHYEKDTVNKKYIIVNDYKEDLQNYSNKHKGFIPRMTATSAEAIRNYKSIAGISENSKRRPTFGENIKFMVQFQFGYMYGRYFMWNFVGRQDDEQGKLDILNGNWLSGINFIDEARLGPQTNLPSDISGNKGRNVYYFLPLILGLIGVFFQLNLDLKNFYVLLLFFVFTGLAIIFYTNPKPFEPRERDYAVVGSFYVFAIWIGFGVLALYEKFKDKINKTFLAFGVSALSLVAVPSLMANQNWNDHDRSGRFSARSMAQNYLDSCQNDAILFTIGDNDTYPLWYIQEIEGYRRDIKIVNSSLFNTAWYIDQMKRKTYDAEAIPSQLTHDKYKNGSREIIYGSKQTDKRWDIKDFMNWIVSEDDRTRVEVGNGHKEVYYPTNKIRIPVDKDAVLKNGIVALKDSAKIVPYIDIDISESGITKNRVLMLDILANNNWKRPIYFTGGSFDDEEYIWLKNYLQVDGLAYKLVPILKNSSTDGPFDMGSINTETMYQNVKKWDWGNVKDPNVYLDVETRRNSISFRGRLERLASAFIDEGNFKKAEEVLDISINEMPVDKFGYYSLVLGHIEDYYKIGAKEKAQKLSAILIAKYQENLKYYAQFNSRDIQLVFDEIESNLRQYQNLIDNATQYDDEAYSGTLKKAFIDHIDLYKALLK